MYRLNYNCSVIVDVLVLVESERKLREKSLVLREVIYGLREILDVGSIALIFGSAVENVKKAEDVDLLVVGKLSSEAKKKVKKIEGKINKSVHVVEVESLGDVSGALREEVRKKHLIVQGSENIVRWLI